MLGVLLGGMPGVAGGPGFSTLGFDPALSVLPSSNRRGFSRTMFNITCLRN